MSSSRRYTAFPIVLLAALTGACDVPDFHGPQIQNPPPAFFLQDEAYQQRRMFPEREITYHDAWVETAWGHFSAIYINGHAGTFTEDDVRAAQESAKAAALEPVTFGPIETLTIDGRESWGWAERLQTPEKGLDWIAYRAVVPYDTISYAIELLGGEPGLKGKPDTLKVILSSFAVGRTTYNLPLIAVLAGVGLFVANFVRSRSRERQLRHQSITLKQIPKKKEEDGAEGDGAPAGPHRDG